jgi:hypothetical protein
MRASGGSRPGAKGGKCTLLYNGLWKMNALGWEFIANGGLWACVGKSVVHTL